MPDGIFAGGCRSGREGERTRETRLPAMYANVVRSGLRPFRRGQPSQLGCVLMQRTYSSAPPGCAATPCFLGSWSTRLALDAGTPGGPIDESVFDRGVNPLLPEAPTGPTEDPPRPASNLLDVRLLRQSLCDGMRSKIPSFLGIPLSQPRNRSSDRGGGENREKARFCESPRLFMAGLAHPH